MCVCVCVFSITNIVKLLQVLDALVAYEVPFCRFLSLEIDLA